MSTFLFNEIIFGPVYSRRLGVSLGINLLPVTFKYCNFSCIYCECGWSLTKEILKEDLSSRKLIAEQLEIQLKQWKEKAEKIDAITFAGNGEPTLHPEFSGIMEDTVRLRNEYFPAARIAVLTNATRINNPEIAGSLILADDCMLKLDAGTEETFQKINQPVDLITLDDITSYISQFPGRIAIQSMFIRKKSSQEVIDNTTETELEKWLERLKKIKPDVVYIYSVARDTPSENVEKFFFNELENIANKVRSIGLKAVVYK